MSKAPILYLNSIEKLMQETEYDICSWKLGIIKMFVLKFLFIYIFILFSWRFLLDVRFCGGPLTSFDGLLGGGGGGPA